ncbi:MAG: addiction module protein [Lacipirellulaceae bacterium]
MQIPNDELLDSVLALPPDQRADLATRLIDSLACTGGAKQSESEVAREVQRRSAEMDSGAVVGVPWSEVRAELRSRIARRFSS